MCTALTLTTRDHYFGRTLDLDCSYGEEVVVLPRRFPLTFRQMGALDAHHALIGMAAVVSGVPLFYDAANEHGLSMAGLNFPGNAFYPPQRAGKDNVAPFEFIPWILGQCKTVQEARALLDRINLVNLPFSPQLPLSPLHWILADRDSCIVVESMADGLHIHDNPAGVMTNNPPFEFQMMNLANYRSLSAANGANSAFPALPLREYCQGLGGLGLPGDVSSMSRFVRIAFGRANSACEDTEAASVSQFFHLLGSVEMVRGVCRVPSGHHDITVYTACINAARGLYYYTTYSNQRIRFVDMHRENLCGEALARYPLRIDAEFAAEN